MLHFFYEKLPYVDMQALSTMLNLNINILTTGIPPVTNLLFARCKPSKSFRTEDDLIEHIKSIHNRLETEEEKEGRVQRARWSEMRPDPRLQEYILNEQPEELILLHEEYIHYNLIVHRSHNAFKN